MDESLLKEAQRQLPNLDFVVDLFDLSFLWTSQKLQSKSGYLENELSHMRLVEFSNMDEASWRKTLEERLVKIHGTAIIIIHNKQGLKMEFTEEYKVFTIGKNYFMAGKGISLEQI